MSTHTPGPWFTMLDSTKEYIAVYAKVGAGAKVICPVKRGDVADANLIAAAPELLQACRDALFACVNPKLRRVLETAIANADGGRSTENGATVQREGLG